MKQNIQKPSVMLPGNTPGALSPVIPIEYINTVPVSLVRKNSIPLGIQTRVDSIPSRAEEEKITDASRFPILRGFA